MAGNAKLTSTSPELGFVANNPNGLRGNYSCLSLDRPGSFRESSESRLFGSGSGVSRVSGTMNLPPLAQSLMLEPLTMSDQKYTRSGELRRILGVSMGSALEENSFGGAHSRPSPLTTMEELKRYKESILDSNNKARVRAKKLDEHLHKLNKYCEAVNSKKQQRNGLSINKRAGGLNMKLGTQIHRNAQDLGTKGVEDRSKNTVPSRRVRTSMAEARDECRSNGLARKPLVMPKDRDTLTDSSPGSDLVEEKIRGLSSAGEGWDKNMKRKRSVGMGFTRSADTDEDIKRPLHHKSGNECGLQSFRVRSPNERSGSTDGTYKLDSSSSPASYFDRTSEYEQEKPSLMRDKEKLLAKGSNKLNIRENNGIVNPRPVTKGKASRAPRSGAVTAANSSPNVPHVSEVWGTLSTVNKVPSIRVANNRKRTMPSGSSSSPHMAQWVGQRPQKISRIRRTNLVSPVSKLEGMKMSPETSPPSDLGNRINSSGTNGSLILRGVTNGSQQRKSKCENILSSETRFSGNEEIGNKFKKRVIGSLEVEDKAGNAVLNARESVFVTKKEQSHIKEELSGGVQRQGRRGRGSSFAGISPVTVNMENTVTTKPPRSTTGSDKNGSKTGRPLKKVLDQKGFSRCGHVPNSGSPDVTVESDDHEELLTAANLARNASYDACSSLFWRKIEPVFASLSSKDTSYFSQQVKYAEELQKSLSQGNCCSDNFLGEISASKEILSEEIGRSLQNQIESNDSVRTVKFADQLHDFDICGKLDLERSRKVPPLYQILLSALIVDDEIEELEENGMGRNDSLQCCRNVSQRSAEPRKTNVMEFECETPVGAQASKQYAGNRFFSCNGNTTSGRSPVIQNPPQNNGPLRGENGYLCSDLGVVNGISCNDLDRPHIVQSNSFNIPSSDCQYEKMCIEDKLMLELRSLGIYVDPVPDLDDREGDKINQEIIWLKNGLQQQIGRKKDCLDRLYNTIQQRKEAEARDLEQIAMDKHVELSYKKLLATQEIIASNYEIGNVRKKVDLSFAKRTLSRCRNFEDSGTSCFNEPVLKDALFAAPREALGVGSFVNSSLHEGEKLTHQSDHGPISNRGKKKEVLKDDVGAIAASIPTSSVGSILLGGAKGKRSERDVSSRNTIAKAGRPPSCKLKSKPKQKTSGNGFVSKYTEATHSVNTSTTGSGNLVTTGNTNKRELDLVSPITTSQDLSMDTNELMDFSNLPLPDFDSIDGLGVGTDLEVHQDLGSWLNFDEDDLHDHDAEGLAIPMDDLTELGNMF